ncbi:MAG: membrane-associated phospholipid phosphatase [Myxococcota bacterium]
MTIDHNAWLSQPLRIRDRIGALVVGVGLLMPVYNITARIAASGDSPPRTLPVFIDDLIGLHPWSMLIYGGLYLQAFAPLMLMQDRRVLVRSALAYTALVLSGVPLWLLWPVTVPRSPVPVEDLFTWGLALMRWLDPPTNCFPSMHVAESFLAALVIRRLDRVLGQAMLVSAVLIWWSTMALAQHWFVDGLAGLLIAVAVDHLAFGRRPLPASALQCAPRSRMVWALGIYLLMFLAMALPWWTGWLTPADIAREW